MLPKSLPASFWAAVQEFNEGEYFACHETLEALWLEEKTDLRLLYQGVLQIAVGCFHLTVRRNFRGAVKKLDQGARKLELFLPSYDEFDTADLLEKSDRLRLQLVRLGEEHIEDYQPQWLFQIAKKE